jgi:hypothetical protein
MARQANEKREEGVNKIRNVNQENKECVRLIIQTET